jgi:hypothetical protein
MVITNEDLVYNTQVGFVKGMTAIFKREMCDKSRGNYVSPYDPLPYILH